MTAPDCQLLRPIAVHAHLLLLLLHPLHLVGRRARRLRRHLLAVHAGHGGPERTLAVLAEVDAAALRAGSSGRRSGSRSDLLREELKAPEVDLRRQTRSGWAGTSRVSLKHGPCLSSGTPTI